MSISVTAETIGEYLDPSDVEKFGVRISQVGDQSLKSYPILDTGEGISAYTVALQPEAVAAGLVIQQGAMAPSIIGNLIVFWLGVVPEMRDFPPFVAGLVLGVEVTITTSSGRVKQQTVAIRVVQR